MTNFQQSLQFALAWRLAALLFALSIAGVAGLYWHVGHVEQQHTGNSALVHEVLIEFFTDMAWAIPVVVALALAIGIWSIRQGLAPLDRLSAAARTIQPGVSMPLMLAADVPSEVRPLVMATDAAVARLQDAYAVQSRFTANAAHELRTPLAVLRSGLERFPASAERTSLLEDTDRMARLVQQLLELARVEAVEQPGKRGTLDLAALVRDTATELAPFAVQRRIDLALSVPVGPIIVIGIAAELHALVRNLTENAILHTPADGTVHITLDIGPHAKPRLIVDDSGPGIAVDVRAKVFERFWRAPGATGTGSGLGLSIAAEVARQVSAQIVIDTAPLGGARLVVAFPGLQQ